MSVAAIKSPSTFCVARTLPVVDVISARSMEATVALTDGIVRSLHEQADKVGALQRPRRLHSQKDIYRQVYVFLLTFEIVR